MTAYPTLYNVDSKGKVRTWLVEVDGDRYRAVSGLADGKQTQAGWVTAEPKNPGKANATTGEEQAALEVDRLYTKKLESKYYRTLEEAQEAGSGKKFFEPMLAEKWKDYVKRKKKEPIKGSFTQPKLDGFRCIANGELGTMSRSGKPIVTVPHVVSALKEVFAKCPGIRLDGELYNHDYRENFNELSSMLGGDKPSEEDLAKSAELVQYWVYDVPTYPGTYRERREYLTWIKNNVVLPDCIRILHSFSTDSEEEVNVIHDQNLANGYEGSMVRFDTEYVSGRTWGLLKRKEFFDAEYEVVEIKEGAGSWAGIAKIVTCRDKKTGELFDATPKGTMEVNRKILQDFRAGIVPKEVTVRYPNLTPRGIPRFGQVVAWWPNGRDL